MRLEEDTRVKIITETVYPSEDRTVACANINDEYGGAHTYQFQNCLGFVDGKTKYADSIQTIQFVRKNADGSVVPGLQNEQLIYALLNRDAKLNTKYPDVKERVDEKNECLLRYLKLCKERVDDRISRGAMGDLKK